MNSIIDQLYSEYDTYFDSEKKIATYIINHPKDVIHMTIKELAKECSTSEASISRFCKKLETKSFHHLKITLARDISSTSYEGEVSNTISRKDINQSLENILANKIEELQATIHNMDEKELDEILLSIKKAKRVHVVAVGNTIPVAMDCMFKFNELGVPTTTNTVWENQVGYLYSLGKNDVLIAISNSGESTKVLQMVEVACQQGVTTIGITNNKNSAIGRTCQYHIQTSTREKVFMNEYCFSRISASTVIEVLYLFLANDIKDGYERTRKIEEFIASEKI